jgi:dihydropteroate synthase
MKYDLTDTIADLVFKSAPDLADRLKAQAEALNEATCINPLLGKWIDANDVKYLLSTFALGDKDFAEKFPSMAHTTEEERRRVIAAFEEHFEHCTHCSLKRAYDLELDARIKKTCQENSNALLQLLEEEESESSKEDDHSGLEVETVLP